MPSSSLIQLAFGIGVLSHLLYFNQGEHHNIPWRYVQFYTLCYFLAVVTLTLVDSVSFSAAAKTVNSLALSYFTGLFTNLVVYRLGFHPLRKFPGPLVSRISSLYQPIRMRNRDGFRQLQILHEKYGRFVRIGGSELSIVHPEAPEVIHGPNSRCIKGPQYDTDRPALSLHSTRDRVHHDARRRVWSPAFSDRALRGYEPRIRAVVDDFVRQVDLRDEKSVNVTQLFKYFGFDVMADLTFGTTFNMLKDGKEHWAISCLTEGMKFLAFFPPAWFMRFAVEIPGLAAPYWRFVNFCNQLLEKRIETGTDPETPDIMHALLKPYADVAGPDKKLDISGTDLLYLQGDARLIVVAGSDTTSAALTYLFYRLVRNPSVVAKLRTELAPLLQKYPNGDVKAQELQNLEYLNSCINETLRLNPPAPSALARITPREGLKIGDIWIPGDIQVLAPQYLTSRDETIYPDALSFIPERWLEGSELLKTKAAYAPFSLGAFGCIGKNLALMEIRMITVKLLAIHDDIMFAPGEDGTRLFEQTTEQFTLQCGPLDLIFKRRDRNVNPP